MNEPGQVVLPDEGAGRRRKESWPAMLRRWLVECPRCAEVWLVVGARENDRHVCKDCGHGFVVRFLTPPPAARRERTSTFTRREERRVIPRPDVD
jgi:ribosomal protein S27AE